MAAKLKKDPRHHFSDEDGGTVYVKSTWQFLKTFDISEVQTDTVHYTEARTQTNTSCEIEVHSKAQQHCLLLL